MGSEFKGVAFTLEQAAKAASVSVPTVRAWTALPGFPVFRSGRRWIIPVSAFEDWLRDQAEKQAKL